MISSAIWDKSARVNFSKANQIARARRASAIWLASDLFKIAREKSCDYLLIIPVQKCLCKWMTNKMCSVAYLSESLLKHYGVAKLCKSKYCYGILKLSVMHYQVFSSSFSYMGMS